MAAAERDLFICPQTGLNCEFGTLCVTNKELNAKGGNKITYALMPPLARAALDVEFCSYERADILRRVAGDTDLKEDTRELAEGLASGIVVIGETYRTADAY